MNAPANIPTAKVDPETDAKLLVQEILTGQHPNGPYPNGLYGAKHWHWCARWAADSTEYSEIVDMMAEERKHELCPCEDDDGSGLSSYAVRTLLNPMSGARA